MIFSSQLLEQAVNEMAKLPGIGKKTALRLILHLLQKENTEVLAFTDSIKILKEKIQYCEQCFNFSDGQYCNICSQSHRNKNRICVVESIRELMAIENTQQYNGSYHVLGALISPIDGVGPEQLKINELIQRIEKNEIEEIIFALSPTLEGDTTTYYICKKIEPFQIHITTLSRGVAFGGDLEYADEFTLAKSMENRVRVEQISNKEHN